MSRNARLSARILLLWARLPHCTGGRYARHRTLPVPRPAQPTCPRPVDLGRDRPDRLAATEARLAALPAPTDADRFALAGVRFLGAVEEALHLRWNMGLSPTLSCLPFFALPIPDNPNPPPFQPAMFADLFRNATERMPGVAAPLAEIADDSSFGLEIDLGDLWFDIDGNGARDPGESALDVIGPMLMGWQWSERDPASPAPVVRFDVADAAWLSAYSQFIQGFGNTLLAYDPTAAITEVAGARPPSMRCATARSSRRCWAARPTGSTWPPSCCAR